MPIPGYSPLLRPLVTAGAVLVLGAATPALAAGTVPANAGPDPSPAPGLPRPDPYPSAAPPPAQHPAPVRPTPPTVAHTVLPRPKARRAPRHARRHTPPAARRAPVPVVRPEPPAPAAGRYVFQLVAAAGRADVPTSAALAVALLVLVSGAFVARAARTVAR